MAGFKKTLRDDPQRWIELGRRMKAAQQALDDAIRDAQHMLTLADCKALYKTRNKIDEIRMEFEGIMLREHPSWTNEALRVFCGTLEPLASRILKDGPLLESRSSATGPRR